MPAVSIRSVQLLLCPVGWLKLLVEKPIDRSQQRLPRGEVGVVVIGILDQCPMSIDGRRLAGYTESSGLG
jgi:hypothetical protein